MLYEVITSISGRRSKILLRLSSPVWARTSSLVTRSRPSIIMVLTSNRITSYNVCYTKLLRGPRFDRVSESIRDRRENVVKKLKKINAFVKMGSYAWVVSGKLTDTGNPMIYSGPQMGFSVPAIVAERNNFV